jgi:hypothetical protein
MPKAMKKIPVLTGYEENLPYTGATKDKAKLITYECRQALLNYYDLHKMTYEDYEKEALTKISRNDQTIIAATKLKYYCRLGNTFRSEELSKIESPNTKLHRNYIRAIKFLSELFEKREEALEGVTALRMKHLREMSIANMQVIKDQILKEFPHRTKIIIDQDQGTIGTEVLTQTQAQAQGWTPFQDDDELDQSVNDMLKRYTQQEEEVEEA